MRKLASLIASVTCGLGLIIACSSAETRPPPSLNGEGGPPDDASPLGEAGDAEVPASCRNTTKDDGETDIDCGGKSCLPCALGKACTEKKDCAEGAECENKICALCHDNKTNGDETDVDCGGKACGPCTVGKRCAGAADCRSNSCIATACACPPDMTIIALSTGGAYCIDQSEVSKGQYNKFITANVPVTDQAAPCLGANTDFIPHGAWPPAVDPGPLAFNLGLPVHYVDWCDATAYCKWAKKQLCGTINGAALPPTDANVAAKSAWYNACSAQGTKTYPYGAVPYDPSKCNGDGAGTTGPGGGDRATGFGFTSNQDDGVYQVAVSDNNGAISGASHTACQGGSVGVYQMSGNVAEWEDSCDSTALGAACRVRGGSYAESNNPTSLRCDAARTVARMPTVPSDLKDVGIRCCVY